MPVTMQAGYLRKYSIQFYEYTAIHANAAFSLAGGTHFNQDWPISESVLIKIVPPANESDLGASGQ